MSYSCADKNRSTSVTFVTARELMWLMSAATPGVPTIS